MIQATPVLITDLAPHEDYRARTQVDVIRPKNRPDYRDASSGHGDGQKTATDRLLAMLASGINHARDLLSDIQIVLATMPATSVSTGADRAYGTMTARRRISACGTATLDVPKHRRSHMP